MRRVGLASLAGMLAAFSLVLTTSPVGGATPKLVLKPTFGPPTSAATATVSGYPPATVVTFRFDTTVVGTSTTSGTGGASKRFTVPAGARPGPHQVTAVGGGVTRTASFLVRTDWPTFQFNAARTGANTYENAINKTNVANIRFGWAGRFTSGSQAFRGAPTVWRGRIYIGSSMFSATGCGSLVCPAPLWRGMTDSPVTEATPTIGSGKVFVGGDGTDPGKLYVFDASGCGAATCLPLWTGNVGGEIQSSAALAGQRVYVSSSDGYLNVFDIAGCGAATCQPLWRGRAGEPRALSVAGPSSPAVAGSRVFVAAYDTTLGGSTVAFPSGGCGASLCLPLWRADTSQGIANTEPRPVVAGGTVFVGAGDGRIYALNATTGAPRWPAFSTGGPISPAMSPVVTAGTLFAGSGNGYLWAIDVADGSLRWSADLADGLARSGLFTSPVAANGLLFIANNYRLKAYDLNGCGAATCSPVAVIGPLRDEPGSPGVDEPGTPIVVNGTVLFAMQDRDNFGSWMIESYSP